MGLRTKQVEKLTFFSSNSRFVGEVSGEGTCEIHGKVKGRIDMTEEIVISAGAEVEGQVKSASVHVLGRITGDIVAKDIAKLGSQSFSKGSIDTFRIMIEAGAQYGGTISMSGTEKSCNGNYT